MTNKITKSALLTSSISLLLCFAMLIGTTFAWFTDTASTGLNKIQAGKLDVALLMYSGNKYVDISDDTAPIFGTGSIAQNNNAETLWEPGKTQVAYLAIENKGNLDLKYNVNLMVKNVKNDLYKVMEYAIIPDAEYGEVAGWTSGNAVNVGAQLVSNGDVELAKGAIHKFALAIHMKEEAGNEYQEGQVDFDITVNATQLNSEADSFGNTYDEDATYDLSVNENGLYETNSMAGLSAIASLASSDSSITEAVYVDTQGNETTVPVVRSTADMNKALAENDSTIVLTEGTYTVGAAAGKTVTLVGNENTKVDVTSGLTYVRGANVTFEGLTIQSAPEGAGYTNGLADAQSSVFNNCIIDGTLGLDYSCEFNNCEFNIEGNYYNVWTWGAGTAKFNGCTFNSDGKALLVYANVLDNGTNCQTVEINNCVFNDNGDDTVTGKAAIEIGDDYNKSYNLIINNTTVNGYAINNDGINTGTTLWANKNSLGTDELNVIVNGVDVY